MTLAEMVLSYIESFMGSDPLVWRSPKDGTTVPFQVLGFTNSPSNGSYACVTFGLSAIAINSERSGSIRIELLICSQDDVARDSMVSLLIAVGRHLLDVGEVPNLPAVLPGEDAVFGNAAFQNLYLTRPISYPSAFYELTGTDPNTYFVAVLPISSRECRYIERTSPACFEAQLARKNINTLAVDTRDELALD
jgi:hypothetical protein